MGCTDTFLSRKHRINLATAEDATAEATGGASVAHRDQIGHGLSGLQVSLDALSQLVEDMAEANREYVRILWLVAKDAGVGSEDTFIQACRALNEFNNAKLPVSEKVQRCSS